MNLSEIERIARAAQERNPGPWRRSRWNDDVEGDGRFDYIRDSSPKPDGFDDYDGGVWRGKTVLETDGGYYEPKEATAIYIAQCSPDVVMAMVARIRELEADSRRLDVYRDALRRYGGVYVCETCMRTGQIGSHSFNTDGGRPRFYCRECK